ncbi:MAG: Snf7 family protein [Candidatus Bathyarchaeia archaeon]
MFEDKIPIRSRIMEGLRPTPLKKRITLSLSKMKVQLRRLDNTLHQLEYRDKKLYDKCVKSLSEKNVAAATMYANECAEVRKIAKMTLASQLALERVTLRLETVREFGDIAYNMNQAARVVSLIKDNLANIVPEVSSKLDEVNDTLQDLMVEVGEATESSLTMSSSGEDAEKIFKEASILAEQKLKDTFPEIPQIPTEEPAGEKLFR